MDGSDTEKTHCTRSLRKELKLTVTFTVKTAKLTVNFSVIRTAVFTGSEKL